MSDLIVQGKLVCDDGVLENGILICEQGKIVYAGPSRGEIPDVVCTTGYLVPGYVDIHIHGANGYDVMDGTADALRGVAKSLASYGVTSFLATTLTASIDQLVLVLDACKRCADDTFDGAELLGVHLEGPWINSKHKGAQNADHVIGPTIEDAKTLLSAGGGLVKLVTMAPENQHADAVIAYLSEQGVKASVGHSDATYEQVKAAIPHGLSHVTHCYNAMRGLHHREPGVVGAAMYHDELTAELIADGIHVHPVAMSILYRLKQSDRLVLVSDSMRAVGMEDGRYDLGGLSVYMQNGEARLADGTLAGSTLTLEKAVQNMVTLCGVPLAEAVKMASATPARVIGAGENKGRLQAGYDADFLYLDEELRVVTTYRAGQNIYERHSG
ncbi:N-acetylglucosamine-6-phosphate deacetylase [Tumebacillus algifaecis]|uniref:N-acetylglucosamine-6-phosphate deacetylase n=1 Tax=Tumebacillus algifaecis TaxID=1214604 RepID=A0A223D148_9BACL|nr:N-acetylglucosamine-6-phosphate deacetylase [Tumebacillus algifaecis]ASS75332.1 N-acetylglucosamine-6-phosphate deacetylase [Tumebacillus algifaecis]